MFAPFLFPQSVSVFIFFEHFNDSARFTNRLDALSLTIIWIGHWPWIVQMIFDDSTLRRLPFILYTDGLINVSWTQYCQPSCIINEFCIDVVGCVCMCVKPSNSMPLNQPLELSPFANGNSFCWVLYCLLGLLAINIGLSNLLLVRIQRQENTEHIQN